MASMFNNEKLVVKMMKMNDFVIILQKLKTIFNDMERVWNIILSRKNWTNGILLNFGKIYSLLIYLW